MVEKELLYSKAWTLLSHSERVIYFHLKGEFNGSNQDELKLPYLKARDGFGPFSMQDIMSRVSFYQGMKNLERAGFIDIVSIGQKKRFVKGQVKTPENVYKLSGRWRMQERSIEQDAKSRSDMIQQNLYSEYCERQENETEP